MVAIFVNFVTIILFLVCFLLLAFLVLAGLLERQFLCWLRIHKFKRHDDYQNQALVCCHCNKIKMLC